MAKTKAIILAAGGGTRMKSKTAKVIHEILGTTLLQYVVDSAKDAGIDDICVVVGHQKEQVMASIQSDVVFVTQEDQLGTGHAVMQANDFIDEDAQTLVLFGDAPMITSDTLEAMIQHTEETNAQVTVLSTLVDNADGYGRIIRNDDGAFIKSVEHKDATSTELLINEINSGIYCFNGSALKNSLKHLNNNNAQREYYLPDTLEIIMHDGGLVEAIITENTTEILGINTKVQLADASKIIQRRINEKHMLNGVTIINPDQTYIGKDVLIHQDATLYPNTFIEGVSTIGEDAIIGPNSRLIDSVIGTGTKVEQSTILSSSVGNHTTVGPYAYVRPNSTIGDNNKIGDFVEIKNAVIGNGTKISHLTYVGDADVGEMVNFGCGTVVVNYDGQKKYRTTIEDGAFIGCNTNLVSPVTVHKKAYTAAGSTITEDVPSESLGIARSRQSNIEGWVKRNR